MARNHFWILLAASLQSALNWTSAPNSEPSMTDMKCPPYLPGHSKQTSGWFLSIARERPTVGVDSHGGDPPMRRRVEFSALNRGDHDVEALDVPYQLTPHLLREFRITPHLQTRGVSEESARTRPSEGCTGASQG